MDGNTRTALDKINEICAEMKADMAEVKASIAILTNTVAGIDSRLTVLEDRAGLTAPVSPLVNFPGVPEEGTDFDDEGFDEHDDEDHDHPLPAAVEGVDFEKVDEDE